MSKIDLFELLRTDLSIISREQAAEKYGVSIGTIQNWKNGKPPSADALQKVLDFYFSNQHESKVWEGRKVFLLLPIYDSIRPACHFSLLKNYAKYGAEKIGFFMREKTLITDGRNLLVQSFLKTDGEFAIFIDHDMVLPMGDAVMFGQYGAKLPEPYQSFLFLDRIMSTDLPLVGALYFGRSVNGKAQYAEAFENERENRNAHLMVNPGVKPTKWVATGAMRIHRSVFEKMIEAAPKEFPEIIPRDPSLPYGFFNQIASGIGEDVSFCLRASKVGIQPHVDTACVCLHSGNTNFGPHNTQGDWYK
jgi:transcriptional regulator with XRE-family HTH domain